MRTAPSPGRHLTEWHRIPSSGARAVEAFELDGESYLAIPQLAYDAPGTPDGMNGGNSDTELLILRRSADGYEPYQALPVPGGEDAEFFRIGDRAFLATASIRTGVGPYRFDTESVVYEWDGKGFAPFQAVPTFAAKQWRHFTVAGTHFLALAQGVAVPATADANQPSRIFRWSGERFEPFQDIASQWAYNWHAFEVDGIDFLAHADHVSPSRLYRWDGAAFTAHQDLAEHGGRAFADFRVDGEHYLIVARIADPTRVLRWDGERFAEHSVLDGLDGLGILGGRELAVVHGDDGLYVVRVNFILGTPAEPTTALDSQLYRWQDGALALIEQFPTSGGTDVAVLHDAGGPLVAVSNALSPEARFAVDTVIYRFAEHPATGAGKAEENS